LKYDGFVESLAYELNPVSAILDHQARFLSQSDDPWFTLARREGIG
jgi:hypothetical protein